MACVLPGTSTKLVEFVEEADVDVCETTCATYPGAATPAGPMGPAGPCGPCGP